MLNRSSTVQRKRALSLLRAMARLIKEKAPEAGAARDRMKALKKKWGITDHEIFSVQEKKIRYRSPSGSIDTVNSTATFVAKILGVTITTDHPVREITVTGPDYIVPQATRLFEVTLSRVEAEKKLYPKNNPLLDSLAVGILIALLKRAQSFFEDAKALARKKQAAKVKIKGHLFYEPCPEAEISVISQEDSGSLAISVPVTDETPREPPKNNAGKPSDSEVENPGSIPLNSGVIDIGERVGNLMDIRDLERILTTCANIIAIEERHG